ncbi:ParB/Srx family N-terminal domain-containing protein [Streptomyces canus]|uniref:ParB/Srx family N-terminal domain-containing protein n=1 Tax=Streptomyces canus TaxID=58343 RepID=UPI00339FE696
MGDLTELAGSLTTHGQKQVITVMNRDAYLKANPGLEADLEPDTTHVVVDGSSRLAAAREAGLATIEIMVSDDQGATPRKSSNPPSSPTSTAKTSRNSTKPAHCNAS